MVAVVFELVSFVIIMLNQILCQRLKDAPVALVKVCDNSNVPRAVDEYGITILYCILVLHHVNFCLPDLQSNLI